MILHQRPLSIMYDILSLTNSTLYPLPSTLNTDINSTPEEIAHCTDWLGGRVGPGTIWSLWRKKKSCSGREFTQAVQPEASRYND
jgi:hypothetical protein